MNRQERSAFKAAIKQDSVQVGTRELKAYIGAVLELIAILNEYGEINPGWDEIKRVGDKIDRKCNCMNASIVELALSSRRAEREVNS
jgi:hypothetical protein